MKPTLAVLLALALLAGCASTPLPPGKFRLTLNETLTIAPNAATARLQYGRVVAFNAVQEQDPFCIFEIHTVAEREQVVRPGSFDVTRIYQSIGTIAGLPAMPFASAMKVRVGFDSDGGPSHLYYKTTFEMAPAQRVRSLTCMSNQMAPGVAIMRHLTPAEIRQALGTLITLDMPF